MPPQKGTRFNTHSLEEIERVCNQVFPCKVQSRGYEIHKDGHHTVEIIVGKKINMAFAPDHTNVKLRKNPKFIPDVRVIHIPGGMTEEALVVQIQNIKRTLPDPDMRDIPKVTDREITSIEPSEPDLSAQLSQVDDPYSDDKVESGESDEPVEQDDTVLETMGLVLDQLKDMGERLDNIESSKPKTGTKKSSSKSQTSKKKSAA